MSDDGHPRGRIRRRRARTVLLVVAVLVVLAVAGAGVFFMTTRKPPLDAANAYFGDLAAGDFAAAYDRLCDESKAAVAEDRYVGSLERSLAGIFAVEAYSANPFTVDVNGSRAAVDFEVTYVEAGTDDVTLDLRREGGSWRPCIDTGLFTITSAPTTTAPATTGPATTTTVAPEPAPT
jgi:flagellar basal body-associated protein FliL